MFAPLTTLWNGQATKCQNQSPPSPTQAIKQQKRLELRNLKARTIILRPFPFERASTPNKKRLVCRDEGLVTLRCHSLGE